MSEPVNIYSYLPQDRFDGTLLGRAWLPAEMTGGSAGPSPVLVTREAVYDLSPLAPTMSQLLNRGSVVPGMDTAGLKSVGSYESIMSNTLGERDRRQPIFISPADLQSIKACGVTFAVSMIERVIEERAAGDADRAAEVRSKVLDVIGGEIDTLVPGSPEAHQLEQLMLS